MRSGFPAMRRILVVLTCLASAVMSGVSLHRILSKDITNEIYSHIPLVPLVSIFLIFLHWRDWPEKKREKLFLPGVAPMFLGATLFIYTQSVRPAPLSETYSALASVAFIIGSFLFFLGASAVRLIRFPLVFLGFMVPLPVAWTDWVIGALSSSSVAVASWTFSAMHVPFVREGEVFCLPGFDIEITRLCSGMRSTIAMLLIGLLASHLFLDKFWKKATLTAAAIPLSILKNGLRAVVLYLLGYHVDQEIVMGGFLHNSGGFLFFLLGLGILALLLEVLRLADRGGPWEAGRPGV